MKKRGHAPSRDAVFIYVLTHAIVLLAAPVALFFVSTSDRAGITRMKKNIARLLFRILGKDFRVIDPQNFAPDRVYLVVANYPSFYVFPALLSLFPDASMVAAAFISRVPIFGFASTASARYSWIPSGRGAPNKPSTAHWPAERGRSFFFPEGRRSSKGEINEFQKGLVFSPPPFPRSLARDREQFLPIKTGRQDLFRSFRRPGIDYPHPRAEC